MANAFDRLAAAARGPVERVHGKAVTVYPVARVNANAGPKVKTADAWQTTACFFSDTQLKSENIAQPITGNGRLMHRNLRIEASITLVTGKELAAGFILRREEDGAVFTIEQFDADGVGGVLAVLSRAKTMPEAAGA